MSLTFQIRPATKKDIPAITEIYNWAIVNTEATFDTEEKTLEQQTKWFNDHGESHPIIVVEIESKVVGWGSITKWSDRSAYDSTGEVSLYILPEAHGVGIGKAIMAELVRLGKEKNFRTLMSRITTTSGASLHLHKKFGFQDVGVMRQVGVKFGKVLDVAIMQLIY